MCIRDRVNYADIYSFYSTFADSNRKDICKISKQRAKPVSYTHLDRNDFAKQFTGGYGSVVNGPYGTAQWFFQETKKELDKATVIICIATMLHSLSVANMASSYRVRKDGKISPVYLYLSLIHI